MPLQVVQLVGNSFELLLGVCFGLVTGEHFLVVCVDEIDQLSFVGSLFVFVLGL